MGMAARIASHDDDDDPHPQFNSLLIIQHILVLNSYTISNRNNKMSTLREKEKERESESEKKQNETNSSTFVPESSNSKRSESGMASVVE